MHRTSGKRNLIQGRCSWKHSVMISAQRLHVGPAKGGSMLQPCAKPTKASNIRFALRVKSSGLVSSCLRSPEVSRPCWQGTYYTLRLERNPLSVKNKEFESESEVRMPKRQPCLGREPARNVRFLNNQWKTSSATLYKISRTHPSPSSSGPHP